MVEGVGGGGGFYSAIQLKKSIGIVGPPPPLIKGGVGPSENWVTRGGTKIFAKKGG